MLCRGGDLTARDSIDLCAPEFYNERKLCIYMNRAKLEKLLTENMKAIFGFVLMRTGNTDAAEELSSNILYKIIKSYPCPKSDEKFYGFMWKIAENTYVDYLRKKTRTADRTVTIDSDIEDTSDAVPDIIIKDETLNLLRRELSLLSETHRRATVMYYMYGLSCSDIA